MILLDERLTPSATIAPTTSTTPRFRRAGYRAGEHARRRCVGRSTIRVWILCDEPPRWLETSRSADKAKEADPEPPSVDERQMHFAGTELTVGDALEHFVSTVEEVSASMTADKEEN